MMDCTYDGLDVTDCTYDGLYLTLLSQVKRWVGEPIKTVSVATSLFLTNKKGYPVLAKQHQALLRYVTRLGLELWSLLNWFPVIIARLLPASAICSEF